MRKGSRALALSVFPPPPPPPPLPLFLPVSVSFSLSLPPTPRARVCVFVFRPIHVMGVEGSEWVSPFLDPLKGWLVRTWLGGDAPIFYR